MKLFYPGKKWLSIIVFLQWLWIAAIITAPILKTMPEPWQTISSWLYFFYQPVCHQIESRSFIIQSFPFAVCIRCFGIYFGSASVSTIYIFVRSARQWPLHYYIPGLLPAALDFILEKSGFYPDLPFLWLFTGLIFGMTVSRMIIQSLFTK